MFKSLVVAVFAFSCVSCCWHHPHHHAMYAAPHAHAYGHAYSHSYAPAPFYGGHAVAHHRHHR